MTTNEHLDLIILHIDRLLLIAAGNFEASLRSTKLAIEECRIHFNDPRFMRIINAILNQWPIETLALPDAGME